MTCRRLSRWVAARGVFVGATVVRGSDWKWGNQDGERVVREGGREEVGIGSE